MPAIPSCSVEDPKSHTPSSFLPQKLEGKWGVWSLWPKKDLVPPPTLTPHVSTAPSEMSWLEPRVLPLQTDSPPSQ